MKQYNNDLTPDIIASLDAPRYTDNQLSEINEEARQLVIGQ
ncbi:hypothetical protein [Enterobacter asburiae]|nr:hypothetical protein [Enterobacter asburiae]UUR74445.1 hypothetical protein NQ230_10255 [Enterobacter asburiae]